MSPPSNRRSIIITAKFKLKIIPCSILLAINSIVVFRAWISIFVIEWLVCEKCMQYAINTPAGERAIVGRYQQCFVQFVAFLASIVRAAYCYFFPAKEGVSIAHFKRSAQEIGLLSKFVDFLWKHDQSIA